MDLGTLTERLANFPGDYYVTFNPLNLGAPPGTPTSLHSWRGVYEHLALDFTQDSQAPVTTVATLLKDCEEAKGKTFEGWKGGDFTMNDGTPVWISQEGSANHGAIIDLKNDHTIPGHVCMDIADIYEYWF